MFVKWVLVFAILIVRCSGYNIYNVHRLNTDGSSTTIINILSEVLESLRDRMHMDMSDTLGIPALDPLFLNYYEFDINDSEIGEVKGYISGVTIIGLKEFILNNAYFNIGGFPFVMDFGIPALQINGSYKINGLLGGMLPIFGEGDFNLILSQINTIVDGRIGFLDGIFSIAELTIQFEIKAMNVQFTGLLDNGRYQDFFNRALSELGSEILVELWPNLEPTVSNMAIEVASDTMRQYSIEKLLDMAYGSGEIFPPIEQA